MPWVDMVGYAAALAVLGSFCMTTLVPLRILAVVSNLLFGAYGMMAHLIRYSFFTPFCCRSTCSSLRASSFLLASMRKRIVTARKV
jgi:hypothetical protein